jgi:hypothetical protein
MHIARVPLAGTAEQFAADSQTISVCVHVCLCGHSLIIITTLEGHTMLKLYISIFKHPLGEKSAPKKLLP